jgi:hypothetical protein
MALRETQAELNKELCERIEAGKLMFARLYVDEEKCAPWLDAISQSPPIVLREA